MRARSNGARHCRFIERQPSACLSLGRRRRPAVCWLVRCPSFDVAARAANLATGCSAALWVMSRNHSSRTWYHGDCVCSLRLCAPSSRHLPVFSDAVYLNVAQTSHLDHTAQRAQCDRVAAACPRVKSDVRRQGPWLPAPCSTLALGHPAEVQRCRLSMDLASFAE